MSEVPDQLKNDQYLIKIHGPEADCDHPGKQPVGSATEGPFYHGADPELRRWIQNGGNVGKALLGPVVVFDVDTDRFGQLLDDHLPPTFTVRTGSGGQHRYCHAPDWTDNRQITVDGTDLGSVRSDSWQVVIPPSTHPDTESYRVKSDREIRSVGADEIAAVLEQAGTDSQHSGGGGCVGGSSTGLPAIPDEYPSRPAEWETARSWLGSNGLLEELNRSSGDRSAREFKLAKCLAEGGFSEVVISDALDRLPHDSKWHERDEGYQNRTVRKAVVAACEDEYVEFPTPGDMDGRTSESRKTESRPEDEKSGSSGESTTGRENGGDTNMPEFTDKEEVQIQEPSSPGDNFKKIVRVEGTDEDGETFEYVALKEGFRREGQTNDGETVTFEQVTDSTSLGSPRYLSDLIDGLESLEEKLNGSAE